jgi:hypothetical protein
MTPEERLAAICRSLESVGLSCLIMGGHAVNENRILLVCLFCILVPVSCNPLLLSL